MFTVFYGLFLCLSSLFNYRANTSLYAMNSKPQKFSEWRKYMDELKYGKVAKKQISNQIILKS